MQLTRHLPPRQRPGPASALRTLCAIGIAALALAPVSAQQSTTYLLTMGRYNATPAPWNSWAAWNFPGVGGQITLYDAETHSRPVVARITQAAGAFSTWFGDTAPATADLFGYPIPASATTSAFGFNQNSGTGSFTLELSGLQPSREYEFQGWMKGRSVAPTTWTLTGAGAGYSNTVDGYDASPAIKSTAAGTIQVRYDFVPQWAGSAVECLAFREVDQIVAWGVEFQSNISGAPRGGGFTAIASGSNRGYALREDGSIAAWGDDFAGLVSGTPTGTGFVAVAGGIDVTVALRSDGSLAAWGFDRYGAVSSVPTGAGYKAVAAGAWVGYALDANGSIVAWGDVGLDDWPWYAYTPVPTESGFVAIDFNAHHGLALRADGSIAAFGRDAGGTVSGAPTDNGYVAIAASNATCYALRADGSIRAWGEDAFWAPTGTGFVAISGGIAAGFALRADGSIAAWGHPVNDLGQLSGTPTTGRYRAISSRGFHGYALRAPADSPPVANAGADFSVNEGAPAVTLDGSGSSDPDNDTLTFAWSQIAGPAVTLSDASAAMPTFAAPQVSIGGATLTFELTVTANDVTATDTVNVTIVNLNHPPVADAGADQELAEGTPVTLHGEDSFDIDLDAFSYAWVQISGPAVTLTGATTANPTFVAPFGGGGGAPGIVAELVFELLVDDGYPAEVPAPGFTFANVRDRVTITVLNINTDPVADAGTDQTRNENVVVTLSGAQSSDPDNDALTYSWLQTAGPAVTLAGATTGAPSFTTPFVSAGGADLTFELTVDDGYGGRDSATVVVHVQNVNDPPNADAARPSQDVLWPPNHKMVAIRILGVTDPNDNATITIDLVTQDEPTAGTGSGDTPVDAIVQSDGSVMLRAERQGNGDGRVYRIHFTASDLEGSRSGVVTVTVPHDKRSPAVDSGNHVVSTQ